MFHRVQFQPDDLSRIACSAIRKPFLRIIRKNQLEVVCELKEICDACLCVGFETLKVSVLCFDSKVNGLEPCTLDSWMQTDAFVLGKCVEEA